MWWRMRITQRVCQNLNRTCLFLVLLICTVNCFYFTDSLRKAKKALKRGDCEKTRHFLNSSQKTDLVFALKAAEFCEKKSIVDGVWFYKYLSEREKTKEKRFFFKEKLADIYSEELRDYESAFSLWFFLRDQTQQADKKLSYSYKIAHGFFEMQKWEESLLEINKSLNKTSLEFSELRAPQPLVNKLHKYFLFLKGRVLLMQEQFGQAEQVFRQIKMQYPQFFQDQNIYWYLSLIYESQKDFQQAIRELKRVQKSSEFLEDKLERLRERERNLPARPPDLVPSDLDQTSLDFPEFHTSLFLVNKSQTPEFSNMINVQAEEL